MTSRFKVTNAPELAPGVDYVTGTGVGPFIDTGKDITDMAGRKIGRLYLSKDSVAEMARELGLITSHEDNVALQTAYSKGGLDMLKEELGGELHSIAGSLRRWLDLVDPADRADAHGSSQTQG